MGHYLSSTELQQKEMLDTIGITTKDDLFKEIPSELVLKNGPEIPSGRSELEVSRQIKNIAEKNIVFKSVFRGAGSYRHYIPSIVTSVVTKETFVTAYTPYQAEISQGILQSIFEYQTMICQLTGMDVSNASVYDGATAAAEATAMCRDRKRNKVIVSECIHPDVMETIKTYCWAADSDVVTVPSKDGRTDIKKLRELVDKATACVYIQQPNFLGNLEHGEEIGNVAHEAGAKYIMGINPIAAATIKTPGECGADIAVGEGQPLGMPMAFGGPYLGFMAAKKEMSRKLPGRIAGETTDSEGKRAYVLTLQAREQHIRREKASSNICSNQALCAMTAAVYMASMGPEGLKKVSLQSASKAHYLAEKLSDLPGFELSYEGLFFHEFVTKCPIDTEKLLKHLEQHSILGGLPVKDGILWCATELNTKEEIDHMVSLIKEVCS